MLSKKRKKKEATREQEAVAPAVLFSVPGESDNSSVGLGFRVSTSLLECVHPAMLGVLVYKKFWGVRYAPYI